MQTSSDVYAYFVSSSNSARVANTNVGNGGNDTIELSKLGIKVNDKNIVAPGTAVSSTYNLSKFGLDVAVDDNGLIVPASRSADNSDPAMRLRSIKIYSDLTDETSLIVDAIPVKRTGDGVVCLYNKVDGTYIERKDGSQPAYGELS